MDGSQGDTLFFSFLKTGIVDGTTIEVQKTESLCSLHITGPNGENFPEIPLILYLPFGQVPGAFCSVSAAP